LNAECRSFYILTLATLQAGSFAKITHWAISLRSALFVQLFLLIVSYKCEKKPAGKKCCRKKEAAYF
jgi:hypothetical protein